MSDDQPFRGYALRGGIELNALLDVALTAQYWPDLRDLRGRSVLVEASFYPLGRPRVAPYVFGGVGHFSARGTPGSTRTTTAGRATAVGVGVHGRLWHSWGANIEALVRFDATAEDDELRGFLTYAPAMVSAGAGLQPPQVTVALYEMVVLSGPWHFVEPGFGMRFATPVTARTSGALSVTLFHWRMRPGFDTRAALLMPGVRWHGVDNGRRLYVQGGPLISLMLEGPDDGARGGADLECGLVLGGGRTSGTAGLGWMWLIRSPDRFTPGDPGTDQHALLAHIGITF